MSLTLKFALFTSLLCLLIIGGITFFSYRMGHRELETSLGERLEAIVRSGAFSIDGTLHDQIRANEDASGVAFQTIQAHLRELKKANRLDSPVYTFRREGEILKFVVMTNEKPYVGDTYSIRPEMLPTLNDGKSGYTGVYHDSHGSWISAYAPIFDRNGQISGLLEADIKVEHFLSLLKEKFIGLVWKGLGFGLFAVAMSFLLAKTVTRRLNYLTDLTEKISLGKMDTAIRLNGRDEVSKLAESLERMRESLKIAAEMIR